MLKGQEGVFGSSAGLIMGVYLVVMSLQAWMSERASLVIIEMRQVK